MYFHQYPQKRVQWFPPSSLQKKQNRVHMVAPLVGVDHNNRVKSGGCSVFHPKDNALTRSHGGLEEVDEGTNHCVGNAHLHKSRELNAEEGH